MSPKSKMAYKADRMQSLYMPFLLSCSVLSHTILSDTTFAVLFLILSIISTAFAVCIPKKIQRISVFLFRAFILESE